jgi:hypothetical protein
MYRAMSSNPDFELISYTELRIVSGGAGATRTTINAPLSGRTTVKQNIGVNLPKGPVSMTWGAKTFWGDFSWSFTAGK